MNLILKIAIAGCLSLAYVLGLATGQMLIPIVISAVLLWQWVRLPRAYWQELRRLWMVHRGFLAILLILVVALLIGVGATVRPFTDGWRRLLWIVEGSASIAAGIFVLLAVLAWVKYTIKQTQHEDGPDDLH